MSVASKALSRYFSSTLAKISLVLSRDILYCNNPRCSPLSGCLLYHLPQCIPQCAPPLVYSQNEICSVNIFVSQFVWPLAGKVGDKVYAQNISTTVPSETHMFSTALICKV